MSSCCGAEKVVCVTGASGYIASWLVKLLLQSGYTVKASVRGPEDPKKTQHLMSMDGAKERLHLLAANLLEDGSFDAIVDGCCGVFHVASPAQMTVENPQTDLLEPAVNGTLNVLRSCLKASSVKRVVVTSSTAAVVHNRELKAGALVDETWFSDPAYCEERKMWYALSKTLAEKAAWEIAKANDIDLITIHPGLVIGPPLQPSINFSVQLIQDLVNGTGMFPNAQFRCVDVRDVAYAHVLAFETPSASGRYCLVHRSAHASEIIKILQELYPNHNFSDKLLDTSNLIYPDHTISNSKAKNLGIEFIPLEVSLQDTVESLKNKNFVSI